MLGLGATDISESLGNVPICTREGESRDDLLSALNAALLAIRPLDVLRIEDILFLRCFKGLSRKSLEGDLEGDEEEATFEATETAVAGLAGESEPDTVFLRGLPSDRSVAANNVAAGTETDLECPI